MLQEAILPSSIHHQLFCDPSPDSLAHIAALVARVKHFIDQDINLARHYIERLSQALEAPIGPGWENRALIPARAEDWATAGKGGLAPWQMRKVTEYVERRLNHSLTTEELAAVVKLSTGHFCRAFKASMGETPHGYVVRQRIRRAQILMLETRETLSQIALACGLTDQAHLTRLFRRVLGTTPMAWRRIWQTDA